MSSTNSPDDDILFFVREYIIKMEILPEKTVPRERFFSKRTPLFGPYWRVFHIFTNKKKSDIDFLHPPTCFPWCLRDNATTARLKSAYD